MTDINREMDVFFLNEMATQTLPDLNIQNEFFAFQTTPTPNHS